MENTNSRTNRLPISKYLIAGLLAGLIAAVVNNIYHLSYSAITGVEFKVVVNVLTVTLASIVPLVLAGLVYQALDNNTNKATVIFVIMTIFLTICSMGSMAVPVFPNREEVPEGFYGLTLPMHFIAGGIAAIVIPRYIASQKKKQQVKETA
ncbi:hypothetical protein PZB74_12620 [Porifericola rhodea]|uniref:hypothetical protein n=1 Tax=Porifericola rhodea TaxID=930972 RepID=UPI00266656C8|nr:hypothetical protein [Porifericola rhodea]WKN29810.1 hypothetical protein PZB74_12620 [Porifericola rhodea]